MASLIIILVVAISVAACGKENSSADERGYTSETIRINDSNSYASCVQAIIRSNGMLEQYLPEGITVEWTGIANSTDIRDAVIAGRIDIASVGSPSVITAIENQIPLVIISSTAGAPLYLYCKNPTIKAFEDINENTRITIPSKAAAAHIAFLAKCKDVFGDGTVFDNNLVIIPNTEALASIASSDEYDGCLIGIPTTIRANEIDGLSVLEDLTPVVLDYGITSFFVCNEDFYDNNPVIIEAFRKATIDAIEFIRNHTAKAAEILGEIYDIPPEYLVEALKTCPPDIYVSGYDRLAEFMLEVGILSSAPMRYETLLHYNDIPKVGE